MNMRLLFRIFLPLLALSLLKHVYLTRFAHPMGDDWTYAHQGMTRDLLPWLKGEYLHWNGRYFSNLLVGRGPMVLGLDGLGLYRLVPVGLMLLTVAAFAVLIRVLVNKALSRAQVSGAALILFALYIQGMPDIGEGFYWYTGAVTYQVGNILFLLYLALHVTSLKEHRPDHHPLRTILQILLAILIIGCDEVHMLMVVVLQAATIAMQRKQGSPIATMQWVMLAMVLVCACVVVLAPGNAVRGSNFPEKHRLLLSLWMSTLQTGRFLFIWITNIPLILLSFLYLSVSRMLSDRVPLFQRSFHLTPLAAALLLAGVIFLSIFPAYWGQGILGQHRTVNVGYFLFLPLWFINLTVWSHAAFGQRLERSLPDGLLAKGLALFIALALITFLRNGGDATRDLFSGRAERFDAQMHERYARLVAARADTQDPILLPRIDDPPRSLYLLELREDPSDWVNTAYAKYFGLDGRKVARLDK